jgi:hypothetical protein
MSATQQIAEEERRDGSVSKVNGLRCGTAKRRMRFDSKKRCNILTGLGVVTSVPGVCF